MVRTDINYEDKQYILDKLNSEKAKVEAQIKLVEGLKIESVTEEEWHMLCETPVRHNAILLDIAKATFNCGKEFKKNANEVTFEVDGFTVTVPTTANRGITIDMKWLKYSVYNGAEYLLKPKNRHSAMREYFKVLDSGKYNWYDLAKLRCDIAPHHYSKFSLWLWWFTYAKRKKVDRDVWEDAFKKEDESNEAMYKDYEIKVVELEQKIDTFYKVVDKLKEWGTVRGYVLFDGMWVTKNIDDIDRLTVTKLPKP